MIYDLQAFKRPPDLIKVYTDFWVAWWSMFVPNIRVSAKIYTFPAKAPKP